MTVWHARHGVGLRKCTGADPWGTLIIARADRTGMARLPTACPECGVEWYRGGTASSRKGHRKVDEDSWQCTECHVVVPEP